MPSPGRTDDRNEARPGTRPGPKWSSRSAASRFKHGIFYLLIRLGGQRAAYVLLVPVVLCYALLPWVAARCAPYLSRRFPGRSLLGRFTDRFRLCLGLGLVLVDRAAFGILGPRVLEVDFPRRRELLDLVAEGRGLVLVTAHVGAWQVAMSGLELVDVAVNVVMYRGDEDVDLHYFEHGEPGRLEPGAPPFRIIDPRGFLGGVLESMDQLRRGHVVCIMGDRVWGSEDKTLGVRFLGGQVRLSYAACKLAAATGAPLAVVLSHRASARRVVVDLAAVLRPEELPADSRDPETFRAPLETFARALEDYVTAHPYQFFNFYDMWPDT